MSDTSAVIRTPRVCACRNNVVMTTQRTSRRREINTHAQPRHSVVKLLVEVDQVTLLTAAGFYWAPCWQNMTKPSDRIFIFGNVWLLCLWEEPLTRSWKTPYNVCIYQSAWVHNLTCSNLSLKWEWSFVSVLILLSHHLWSISTDSGCCGIHHPNSEGCLKSDSMVPSSHKINKHTVQPPLLLASLIPFKSILAIYL